jgi:solute carrier family 41
MALIQCQASTVGFIAPIIALGLSLMSERARYLRWREVVLLVASSVITANVANLILGSLMCGVILFARKHHINPDNIATPIAASLGDVTTMILLANISHFLYVSLDTNQWVQNTLLAFLMSLIPIWAYIARNNPYTRKVILNGWYPVCGAMLIQNAGGLVMERALKTFERIANLQLLINGKAFFAFLISFRFFS